MSLPDRHAFYIPAVMRRALCPLALIVLCSGCASSFELKNPFPRQPSKEAAEAQLASYTAAPDYPRGATTRETRGSAIIDRDAASVTIVNPTEQELYAVRTWINGQYVAYINVLPAQRTVTLPASSFVNKAGAAITLPQTRVDLVELQIDSELYRALGPALVPTAADKSSHRIEFAFPPRGT